MYLVFNCQLEVAIILKYCPTLNYGGLKHTGDWTMPYELEGKILVNELNKLSNG